MGQGERERERERACVAAKHSPLHPLHTPTQSFGGLGALSRHAGRLASAIADALAVDALDRGALATINPYSPSLSAAWMLQAAMSSLPEAPPPSPDFIVKLLGSNFGALAAAGNAAARPFLRDTLQF